MGTRGMSGLKSAVLGSVSREVSNAYHRPVVLV
jgi:nucleotide-binding universal stress UspA family protein